MYTYLRVVEERLAVVDASADTVRQRPLAVYHQLVPRPVEAQRRRVHPLAHRQAHEVPTEVVERHPAASRIMTELWPRVCLQ